MNVSRFLSHFVVFLTLVCGFKLNSSVRKQRYSPKWKMMEVTPERVKFLREKSGAGMTDCRRAIAESESDEAAIDWLRKNGLASVAKKSGRVTASGVIGVGSFQSETSSSASATVIEINCETDFVARNEIFLKMAKQMSDICSKNNLTLDEMMSIPFPSSSFDSNKSSVIHTIKDELVSCVATTGENIKFRRLNRIEVSNGLVATYAHQSGGSNLGKIGVALGLECGNDFNRNEVNQMKLLKELAHNLTLHIAASAPEFTSISSIPKDRIDREKDILTEQAKSSGKPLQQLEKIVEGRLKKFYEETVITEQAYIFDTKTKVSQIIANVAKIIKTSINVKSFVRMVLGEGVEK